MDVHPNIIFKMYKKYFVTSIQDSIVNLLFYLFSDASKTQISNKTPEPFMQQSNRTKLLQHNYITTNTRIQGYKLNFQYSFWTCIVKPWFSIPCCREPLWKEKIMDVDCTYFLSFFKHSHWIFTDISLNFGWLALNWSLIYENNYLGWQTKVQPKDTCSPLLRILLFSIISTAIRSKIILYRGFSCKRIK